MHGTPPAEVRIDAALVASLIREQFPQHAGLKLRPLANGWDNVMMRLGRDLLVRLPRRRIAASLIENEQRWLPVLGPQLPLPVPEPLHIGRPNRDFPWPWSIVRWLPGTSGDLAPPGAAESSRLGAFLKALHQPAPADAPFNPVRGVPLATRADAVEGRLARLAEKTDLISPTVRAAWQAALAAPVSGQRKWLHGDLHPQNILVQDGRIVGIIDWGDLNAGDIATDLAAFWMLFDHAERQRGFAAYGDIDAATLARAKGWAVSFGTVLLDAGLVDDPRHAAIGEATLRRL